MIEIIDLLDPTSKYAFEERRAQKYLINPHFGGFLQNKPFLYGSRDLKTKGAIPNLKALNRENKKFSLQILVDSAYETKTSGVVLNDSTFWCTGHYDLDQKITEFISLGSELVEDFEAEFDEDSETLEDDYSEDFFEKRLRHNSEVKQLYISRPGPKLPLSIWNHAIIKINSKTIYFIGGDHLDDDDHYYHTHKTE